MSAPVLQVQGLTRRFGGLVAVDHVDFTLPGGQLHAIIGPNGAGKTTFFNLVSGFLAADSGRVLFLGQDIAGKPPHRIARLGVARTLQIKSVFAGLPVYDNVWWHNTLFHGPADEHVVVHFRHRATWDTRFGAFDEVAD